MAWEVEYTDDFESWWNTLSTAEQEDVDAVVRVLEEKGPNLRRPYSGAITGSKHSNMKELVIQHAGKPYRVLYAFDPRRSALLLVGGDKTGNERWYEEFIPVADQLFTEHLHQLKAQQKKGEHHGKKL